MNALSYKKGSQVINFEINRTLFIPYTLQALVNFWVAEQSRSKCLTKLENNDF